MTRIITSYGAVVYTGNQTKFGQNKNKPILKLSVSDRMTSVFTIVVVILQVCMFSGHNVYRSY